MKPKVKINVKAQALQKAMGQQPKLQINVKPPVKIPPPTTGKYA